jgi:hypothetical protein
MAAPFDYALRAFAQDERSLMFHIGSFILTF